MIHSFRRIWAYRSLRELAFVLVLLVFLPSRVLCATYDCLERDGKASSIDPFRNQGSNATVFVFVRVDCPISNRYAPELNRIARLFSPRGIRFWLVYTDSSTTVAQISQHRETYQYSLDALRDPDHQLADRCIVRVTPEVSVFRRDGQLVYHGRIDDRYVDFGRYRAFAKHHDLEDTLTSILKGTSPPPSSPGVGCAISSYP